MAAPVELKYTKTHEWIKIEGSQAVVGLTEFAVNAIQDVVFLELPAEGDVFENMAPFGVVESVKAVFDVNLPVGGKITAANEPLLDEFEDLSSDPYGKGWLVKVEIVENADLGHLMDAAAYEAHCASEEH